VDTAFLLKCAVDFVDLSVVAPVYNEADGIESLVRRWISLLEKSGLEWEIVLANDGSTDGTAVLLARLAEENSRLIIASHFPNRGYGYALAQGIRRSRGEYVVTIDADGQFDLAEYRRLLDRLKRDRLDFVTGYRAKKADTPLRAIADRALNLFVRCLYGVSFRDTNCAFKLFRGDLVRGIQVEGEGFSAPTELTMKLMALGARSAEMEVGHFDRAAGHSKLRVLRTSLSMLRFLLYLRGRIGLFHAGIIRSL
jgi:dolichol-phosphate mannosyltransferase